MKIKPKPNENLPSLLRRFRKMCEKEGILRDIRKNMAYEKPSEVTRRKKKKSQKRSLQLPQKKLKAT